MVFLNKKLLYWRYDILLIIFFFFIYIIIDGDINILGFIGYFMEICTRDNVIVIDESSVENCY